MQGSIAFLSTSTLGSLESAPGGLERKSRSSGPESRSSSGPAGPGPTATLTRWRAPERAGSGASGLAIMESSRDDPIRRTGGPQNGPEISTGAGRPCRRRSSGTGRSLRGGPGPGDRGVLSEPSDAPPVPGADDAAGRQPGSTHRLPRRSWRRAERPAHRRLRDEQRAGDREAAGPRGLYRRQRPLVAPGGGSLLREPGFGVAAAGARGTRVEPPHRRRTWRHEESRVVLRRDGGVDPGGWQDRMAIPTVGD